MHVHQEFVGRQNTIVPNESQDLMSEGEKRNEVNEADTAKEHILKHRTG